ncbi:MAG: RNA-binding S4 domain-containing protein [Novosphingobium sp.]
MRVDKLLWFLRIVKTRSAAQELVEQGHVRLNSRRIERAHVNVDCGDVLVLPLASGVLIIEILALPQRRGPASEAHECYRVLDERSPNPIAGEIERQDRQKDPPL